jgi:hypothetical protein
MKGFNIVLSAAAAAAALAASQSYAQGNSPNGMPNALNVNVTNAAVPVTAATPLPVTVTNQATTTTVTGSVSSNDNPARQPYVCAVQIETAAEFSGSSLCPLIPTGKRLTVEFVSAFGGVASGRRGFVVLRANELLGTPIVTVPLAFQLVNGFGFDNLIGNQPVRLYIDAGERPHVAITQNSGLPPAGSYSVTVVGHLVDVP